jgi:Pentapeptide repeats (9 copies)
MEQSAGMDWDETAFEAALRRAEESIIDAAGVRISEDHLRRLLETAPEDDERPGRSRLSAANFVGARFEGSAEFGGVTFSGIADFRGASFDDTADFGGTIFNGYAKFRMATFSSSADFVGATFNDEASFYDATFKYEAIFGQGTILNEVYVGSSATFNRDADFGEAAFNDGAEFQRATFKADARFLAATFSGDAGFGEATFNGDAEFGGATVSEDADFGGATFSSSADFAAATFSSSAAFNGATFSGSARFIGATFSGSADFDGATFSSSADFNGATFSSSAAFVEATFTDNARFPVAIFTDYADFRAATFNGDSDFRAATFNGDADFDGVTLSGDADFDQAIFTEARELGPLLACTRLSLDGAVFAQPVRIQMSSRRVSCARTVFRGGADVLVRWADVSLEDADFAEPSLVSELPPRNHANGERAFLGWERPADDGTWRFGLDDPPQGFRPRVVSVRRAKVAELTLSTVDARACRFVGAHGMDDLKLERVRFALPPEGSQLVRRWRPVRWTSRQTVAEERHWRAKHNYGLRWYDDDVRAPCWLTDVSEPPDPEQIAGVYRALRKGREDSKDEPGAADFYYGEMEMRRHSGVHSTRDTPGARPAVSILWLYWLVSGYGLRAGRALVALAITIALGAVLFGLIGFDDDKQAEAGTLVFAVESSISLLRAPDAQDLTVAGHIIQIVLRLAGPLFFGLALLALRGRIKR